MNDLDDLFALARAEEPSPALLARVLADAEAVQAKPAPRRSRWRFLSVLLAGAGAFGGMATAALAGVWIGMAEPAPLAAVTEAFLPDTVDLIPTYEFLAEE